VRTLWADFRAGRIFLLLGQLHQERRFDLLGRIVLRQQRIALRWKTLLAEHKDPAKRIATAQELAQALRGLEQGVQEENGRRGDREKGRTSRSPSPLLPFSAPTDMDRGCESFGSGRRPGHRRLLANSRWRHPH